MTSRSSSCAASPQIGDFISGPTEARRNIHIPAAIAVATVQLADVMALTLAGLLVLSLTHLPDGFAPGAADALAACLPASCVAFMLYRRGGYSVFVLCAAKRQVAAALGALIAGSACFAAAMAVQERPALDCIELSAAWLAVSALFLAAERAIAARLMSGWCADGRIARRVAIIGRPAETQMVVARLRDSLSPAVQIVGVFSDVCPGEPGTEQSAYWPRGVPHLIADSHRSVVDAIIIALPDASAERVPVICAALRGLVADIYVAASSHIAGCRTVEHVGSLEVGLVVGRPLNDWQSMQKAAFDRIGALLLILLISPLLLLIAIAIRLDSAGPALFRQQRTGYNNQPFTCLKFRTMRQQVAVPGVLEQTVRNDRRVTRIGRWLRRTSLDELPQLLNVLRGEMSLVGPRPHAPDTMAGGRLFRDIVADYPCRYRVKPGITGWAQVHGYRGETPNAESIQRRVEYDLFYVQNWSLLLDLKILLRTLLCVLHDPQAF